MKDIRLADISLEFDGDRSYMRIDGQRFHVVRDAVDYLRQQYGISAEMASGIVVSKVLDELVMGEEAR